MPTITKEFQTGGIFDMNIFTKKIKRKERKEGKDTLKQTLNNIKNAGIHSIRIKLISAFIVLIIPIYLLGTQSHHLASSTIENITQASTIETMQQTNKYISLILKTVEDVSIQILSNSTLQELFASNMDNMSYDRMELQQEAASFISSIASNNDFISGISLLVDSKNSISTGSLNAYSLDWNVVQDADWYKNAMSANGKNTWVGSHPEIDATTSATNYIFSSVRLYKNITTGRNVGLLIIDINIKTIEEILKGVKLGTSGELHLVTPDGKDISFSGEDGTSNYETGKYLRNEEFFTTIKEDTSESNWLYADYEGEEHLVVYNKLGNTGFMLVGLIPSAELMEAAEQIRSSTFNLVIIAILIALGLGLFFSTSMGHTIAQLVSAAGRAANGDLTVAPKSRRRDELGILTGSISIMIENTRSLIEQAASISQKVSNSSATVAATSEQLSVSSQEVTRAIQEISQGASEQATEAEQGVVRMDELASKMNELLSSANIISNVSKETMELTKQGLSSVEDLNKKSSETTDITHSILENIQALEEQSLSITKIIKVIDGIADQTNLLALNAAIEAAHAGEMGKGFAVVASEVRKLAEQSMEATREIASIIKSVQEQTKLTVQKAIAAQEVVKSQNQAVDIAVSAFENIAASMNSLADRINEIISKISEMDDYKNRTITAMQNISAVSQESAASVQEVTASTEEQLSAIEELAAFAQELSETADQLSKTIGKFKIN